MSLDYLKTEELDEDLIDKYIRQTDSQSFFLEALTAYYLLISQFWRIPSGLVKSSEVVEVLKESKYIPKFSRRDFKSLNKTFLG